jgi:hypothetical protein
MWLRKCRSKYPRKPPLNFLLCSLAWIATSELIKYKIDQFIREKIGVESYGISVTTLEEVFMEITSSKQKYEDKEETLRQLQAIKCEGHGSGFFIQVAALLK